MNYLALEARPHRSLSWLAQLGMPGVFGVAVIDSSVIPMPLPGSTDLLLLWLGSHRGNPWAMVACAVAGSLLGGYFTWKIGKKGGDAALRRHVPKRLLDRTKHRVEGNPILSVFIPAILPPPIPLSPFILAAGALKISLPRFMTVFAAARTLRYAFLGWLAVRYGRHMIQLWSSTLEKYAAPIEWMIATLAVAGVLYTIWKFRQQRGKWQSGGELEAAPSRGE